MIAVSILWIPPTLTPPPPLPQTLRDSNDSSEYPTYPPHINPPSIPPQTLRDSNDSSEYPMDPPYINPPSPLHP